MNLVYRKIHALILMAAIVVAVASFASTNAFAQVVTLLYEDRSADSQVGTEFEAGNGPFEIRWSASGGKFLVKLVDGNDLELISSAPQSREDDAAGPMTGKMPFEGPGTFKILVEASGPRHVRVVQIGP